MYYFATPFTGDEHNNYNKAVNIRAGLMSMGLFVYSPIVENYHFALECDIDSTFEYWLSYNNHMIERSDGIMIDLDTFTPNEYKHSKGCTSELLHAKLNDIPIFTIQNGTITPDLY